jgi:phage tail-like protein
MMNQNDKNFTYLNREGIWRGHHWDGLAIADDGSLQLLPLPLGDPAISQTLTGLPAPDGPAGITMDTLGSVYFTDPVKDRVYKIDGCDASQRPLPCLRGSLRCPRGVLWSQSRQALLIVDSGHNRVLVFDPQRDQVLEIWGGAGNAPGEFDNPWAIAADSADSFYIADYGNQRVQKFNVLGDVVSSFWQNVDAAKIISKPAGVAAGEVAGAIRVYILDETAHAVFVVDSSGNPVLDTNGQPLSFGASQLSQPLCIAAIGDSVFVGDNALDQVLCFDAAAGYRFAGAAVGYQGPVAAMAAGAPGTLLVLASPDVAPIVLQLAEGFSAQGIFWTDAIAGPGGKVTWHRLQAVCGDLSADAHLQLFFHTSDSLADAPAAPKLMPAGTNPFTDVKWRPKPADVSDVFVGGAPHAYIWCGAWFSGDGLGTPSVSQIRLEFDHETYLADLPAIYRKPGVCCDFLLRLLSLFETFNQANENGIRNLPALFDPHSAPDNYLAWLAEWLAVDLQEDWNDATTRRAIETAFANYARRGTPAGLRAALKEYAGVDAIIEEPLLNASWWILPSPAASCSPLDPCAPVTWQGGENSVLGYTTMAAPAEAQGAVVGTTAVLDQSQLITDSDYGVPLFEDVAFQFSVLVYRGQVNCPATLALVQSVIDQEKPAHTTSQLCILEPAMRVGFQARIGIDTIVGGEPAAMRLGDALFDAAGLGAATVLGGQPPGRVGSSSRLGVTTVVG